MYFFYSSCYPAPLDFNSFYLEIVTHLPLWAPPPLLSVMRLV